MNHHYNDIRSRISTPPKWWDEYAVPRYCDFTPDEVADIYAKDVALVEIACQNCGERFMVAFSWNDFTRREAMTPERIKDLHYGDPPNAGCCGAGPTMNCEDLSVLEFWRKGGDEFTEPHPSHPELRICKPGYFEWRRVPELEIAIGDTP
jgi:hypothetical protein